MNCEINWTNIWLTMLVSVTLAFATFVLVMMSQDHPARWYYLSQSASFQRGCCVMVDIDWKDDEVVYCADDIDKALDVMQRANAALKAGKSPRR